MELDKKEGIVKNFAIQEGCIGTEKTNSEIMVTIFKEGDKFDYFDLFFSREKLIELRDKLTEFLETKE